MRGLPTCRKWAFSLLLLIFLFMVAPPIFSQQNGITSPADGETLSGIVEVSGSAVHPDYLRYELAFFNEANSGAGWIVFAEGSQPVNQGVLAVWDTTVGQAVGAPVFPDGRYQLRLRVVKTDYNYDEYFVTGLTINNAGPTATPTPGEAEATAAAGALNNQDESSQAAGTSVFQPATPLPSLTPFPTPTNQATAVSFDNPTDPGPNDTGGGIIGQLETVDTGRFSQAFWNGVKLTFAIFIAFALYLLIRSLGRRLWRHYWAQKS